MKIDAETRKFGAFTVFVYCCQFFFGGWFLFHGLNYWTEFYVDRTIMPGPGLLPALNQSGLLSIVKVIEILVSVALLADAFVPLAAVAAFPVTLVIAYVNSMHLTTFGVSVGVIIIVLNAIIALGHLDCYLPMLVMKSGFPSSAGIRTLFGGDRIHVAERALSVPTHLIAIFLGIAAAAGVTFTTLFLRG